MSALDTQVGGAHYKDQAIQPIEYIHANGIPFAEGSVIKYVTRWRSKGGIADLKKARHFLDMLIELENKKPGFAPVAPPQGLVRPSLDSTHVSLDYGKPPEARCAAQPANFLLQDD